MFDEDLSHLGINVFEAEEVPDVCDTTVTTWLLPNPVFTQAIDTPQDLLMEYLCYALGETLTGPPGSYDPLIVGGEELYNSLGPLDKNNIDAIAREIEQHYIRICDDPVFYNLNYSDEGFYRYATNIYPRITRFTLFADPDFKVGFWGGD